MHIETNGKARLETKSNLTKRKTKKNNNIGIATKPVANKTFNRGIFRPKKRAIISINGDRVEPRAMKKKNRRGRIGGSWTLVTGEEEGEGWRDESEVSERSGERERESVKKKLVSRW